VRAGFDVRRRHTLLMHSELYLCTCWEKGDGKCLRVGLIVLWNTCGRDNFIQHSMRCSNDCGSCLQFFAMRRIRLNPRNLERGVNSTSLGYLTDKSSA
jgi:hypothetical protein